MNRPEDTPTATPRSEFQKRIEEDPEVAKALEEAHARLMANPTPSTAQTPSFNTEGATTVRQAAKRLNQQRRKKPRSAKTPSVEKLYASLVRDGQVRIVRKKGKPPQIVFLEG